MISQIFGGSARNRLAAIDTSSGVATGWNPGAGSTVYSLAINPSGTTLFVGGAFTGAISTGSRDRIAGFNVATGALTGLSANFSSLASTAQVVWSVAATDDYVYAGGTFSQTSPFYYTVFNSTTGTTVSGLNPATTQISTVAGISSLLVDISGNVYLGGGLRNVDAFRVRGLGQLGCSLNGN